MTWKEIKDSLSDSVNASDITKKAIEVEGDKIENRGADDFIKMDRFIRLKAEREDTSSPYRKGTITTFNAGDGLV